MIRHRLTTAQGEHEEPPNRLPESATREEHKRHAKEHAGRMRPTYEERSTLLLKSFTDSALQRLARKASIEQTSTTKEASAYHAIRRWADVVLFNILKRCVILTEYKRKRTITEDTVEHILKESFRYTAYTAPGIDPLPLCPSYRKEDARKRGSGRARRGRGDVAKKEIKHEEGNMGCVYLERAPLFRLLRNMINEQSPRKELRLEPAAFNLIQLVVEDVLIRIMQYANYIVRETTKGPKDTSKPRRNIINGRDIDTAVTVLKECFPMLAGAPRVLFHKSEMERKPSRSSRGASSRAGERSGGGSARPARAKATAKARATGSGSARAKGKAKAKARARAKGSKR